ncbi:complex I 51 kDa subunit family protein [Sinanaerobacter chloroacetimidivorans]|uniref:SLBB domain-containing protein n=1 Tax=Sinanaerobacter chloroacetimidivorans TaxID=2818044 RepID=A0A8J7W207_9FIRM|nr:NADH-ubiquinone oxidoreductase-F iron-sulfur binding region domain-containing protein [Sinanaerobacter chloroacetimidivorans]MBR0597440.1 SLBB domain-containing protein [Sinanaerobacter chloroacetimidivorans]
MTKTVRFITENFGKYDPNSIDSYLSIDGFSAVKKALAMSSSEIIDLAKTASVRGRGGAAYDMGRKWAQAASVPGDQKVVICNADEGEPCTFKDRSILSKDPFRLIEGMIIAGYTVGAQNGYIYLREEYRHLRPLIKNAITESMERGYLGDNILGTGFSFHIHLYSGAGAYVCGEGSTLIESIEGKSGRPRIKPPFIKECGLFQLPTLVNNVETLAIAAAFIQHGVEDYMRYGTPSSPGTKIISLAGNVKKPGAYEIPFGITLREIIYDIGGGISDDHELKLFQLGGASGKIGPASIIDTPFTYDDLAKVGLVVGSGGILVVDDRTRVIDFLKSIQDFFIHESCGKCTPCREGNRQIAKIMDRFVKGCPKPDDLHTAERFANIMSNCAFCGLGETAQSALLSAIKYFPEEFGLMEVAANEKC